MFFLLSFFACEELLSSEKLWSDTSSSYFEESSVTSFEAGTSISGDLSFGEVIDLSWADNSSVACWPATENLNFTGAHVFYTVEQPPHSKLTARVTPDSGDLDVNVYMLQQGMDADQIPPDVHSVVSCEAGFPQSTDSNPGQEDSTYTTAINNGYMIVIGVAGPEGVVSGGYTLETMVEDYP